MGGGEGLGALGLRVWGRGGVGGGLRENERCGGGGGWFSESTATPRHPTLRTPQPLVEGFGGFRVKGLV